MANKRLFPGVSEEDILENERYEQLMQQSEQEEEKQKQLEDQARKLYLKFGKKLSTIATESKRFVVKQAMMLTGLYALYGIGLAFTKHEHNNLFTKTVSITDLAKANDVYQRTKSKGAKTWALLTNPVKETYSFSNLFDLHADYSAQTLTKPSVTHLSDLRAIRAYLGLASIIYFMLIALQNVSADKKKKIAKAKEILTLWSNGNFDKIHIENEQDYEEEDIEQEETVIEMLENVVSHLSSQDAAAFKKIMAGATNIPFDTAIQIIQGHLKTHPTDLHLISETFDERSIPEEIKKIINQNIVKTR